MQFLHACLAPHPLQRFTRHRKYHSMPHHHQEQVRLLQRAIVRCASETSKSSTACSKQFGTNSLRHRHLQTSCSRTGDLLRELHWLPVQSRIVYKVALLKLGSPTYRCYNNIRHSEVCARRQKTGLTFLAQEQRLPRAVFPWRYHAYGTMCPPPSELPQYWFIPNSA